MLSRVITCTVQPDQVEEFRRRLNTEFLPRIQRQPGFVDNIESIDESSGEFCCMTLWENRKSLERYDSGLFQEIAQHLEPLLQSAPEVKTMTVENSSIHHIKAGTAAA